MQKGCRRPLSSGAACVSAPRTPPWRYTVLQPASAGWDWQAALSPAHQNWYLWATPEALDWEADGLAPKCELG